MKIHLLPKITNICLSIPSFIWALELLFSLLYGNMEAAGAATGMLLLTFILFIAIPNAIYAAYKALVK